MTILSPITVAFYARAAGFSSQDAVIATAIAGPESGYDTEAINKANKDGSKDYGLWQINSKNTAYVDSNFFPPGDGWSNPSVNAKAAKAIYDAQGWRAWSTFRSGAYAPYLPAAQAAVNTKITVNGQDQTIDTANLSDLLKAGAIIAGVPGVTGNIDINSTTGIHTTLNNPLDVALGGLGKVAWMAGGAIAVVLGLLMLAKDPAEKIAGVVAKVPIK